MCLRAVLAVATILGAASFASDGASARPRARRQVRQGTGFAAALGVRLGAEDRAALDALLAAMAVERPPDRRVAPDFVLVDLEGRLASLRAFRGKVVLLNFWATFCPPCRKEMPDLARLNDAFASDGLVVLTIATDAGGERTVRPLAAPLHVPSPALLDPTSSVASTYAVEALPTTFLIDRDGRIVGRAVGGRMWFSSTAQALVRALLSR
jgi:peroxiredoxin